MPLSPKSLTKSQRTKAYVLAGAIGIAIFWILLFLARTTFFRPVAKPLTGPEWTTAAETSAKLMEDVRFREVAITPNPETPGRFDIVGAVFSKSAMDALKERLNELMPEGNFDLKVELIPR